MDNICGPTKNNVILTSVVVLMLISTIVGVTVGITAVNEKLQNEEEIMPTFKLT